MEAFGQLGVVAAPPVAVISTLRHLPPTCFFSSTRISTYLAGWQVTVSSQQMLYPDSCSAPYRSLTDRFNERQSHAGVTLGCDCREQPTPSLRNCPIIRETLEALTIRSQRSLMRDINHPTLDFAH